MLEPLCRSWLEPRRQPAFRSSPAWAPVLHAAAGALLGGGSPNASRVPSPRPGPSPDLQRRARTQGRHEGETWREDTASHADTLLQGRRIYPLALISLGCHTFLVLYAREGNPLKIPPQQAMEHQSNRWDVGRGSLLQLDHADTTEEYNVKSEGTRIHTVK